MDPFGDDHAAEEEQDPAADFLAQERNQLAGLDDDEYDKVGNFDDGFEEQNGMTNVRSANEGNEFASGDDYLVNGSNAENAEDGYRTNQNQQSNGPSFYEPPKIRPSTPDKIRKWREDQKERLEKKDADEEKKKQELRAQAQREIQEWYQLQDENAKKAKKGNRDAERDFIQQRDSDKPGEEWERVARLCDFNPKSAKGTKDVSRLRSIILQLKQGSN